MKAGRGAFLSLFLSMTMCAHRPSADGAGPAPRPAKDPRILEKHGHPRTDDYYWMNQRENPKVIAHLNEENVYLEKALQPVAKLREELFLELKSRVKEDEDSAPVSKDGYFYFRRMKSGLQYPLYLRRVGSPLGPEQLLYDVNDLASGHEFTQCTSPTISDDTNRMIFGCDFQGRRFYTLKGRDLRTGADLGFTIDNVDGDVAWAADNRNFFYVRPDPETLRSYQIWRFDVESGENHLVYEEKDETFSVSLTESPARKHLFIAVSSTMTSEYHVIDRRQPLRAPVVFAPRERGIEYALFDGDDRFYVMTNWKAKNFRLMEAPLGETDRGAWKDVLPHRKDWLLTDVLVLSDWIVVDQKRDGLTTLLTLNRRTGKTQAIPFQDESYLASLAANLQYTTPVVRYAYESLRQPVTTFEYDFRSGKSTSVHMQEVPGYDPAKYRAERVWITARDGTKLPVSLLMPKDARKDGRAPMLVYGYGSYGMSMEPWFQRDLFSLIDRGWVYAMTHVRGGSELGRAHYENGRQMKKMNTFTDFIDSTEALIKAGYGDRARVYAEGGSAGGLLMGAVMNLRPELYRGVIATVPFVDIVTTMLDDSIPLTTSEYDEWGNPNEKAAYDYMLSYSPYDNVKRAAYPHLLVLTGLHDSQVQYWEPAKWVAKLRDHKTNDTLTLMKTDMSAGHGGASGRYERLRDKALEQAFLLFIDR